MFNLFVFILVFLLTAVLTEIVRRIAIYYKIVDKPGLLRKIHKKETPLLGGVAIFFVFFLILYFFQEKVLIGDLNWNHWLGFFIGGMIIIVGGVFDDKYNVSPFKQMIFPVLAILAVLLGGIEIEKITNPLGGYVYLDNLQFEFFDRVVFVVFSDIFLAMWLMGMMYTTKLLDGIDGLVTGVVGVGSLVTFIFTMTEKYYQPDIGFAALVLTAACVGFLVFNFHPAKIFLGEGGSLFLGYALGVLAIISGGKIAIAFLVMGIPILDVVWTIIRRLKAGVNPFKIADRKHLHFRLLDLGIGQRNTVFIYYALSFIFGMGAIFLQSTGKMLAIFFLIVLMIFTVYYLNYLEKNAQRN